MELFLGFVFGCIASMLATIFLKAIPAYRQRPVLSLLRNPRLFIQLHRDTEQKKNKTLIDSLFRAWEETLCCCGRAASIAPNWPSSWPAAEQHVSQRQ